jgi:hypothetical protein
VWMIAFTTAFSQARIIMPDQSQITSDPDSLDLLPQQSQQPSQSSSINHLVHDHGAMADSLQALARMTLWRIDARTGNRIPAESDTLIHNYQHTTLPDGQSVAMGFLGPLGAPMYSKIFSEREETQTFLFNNAYSSYLKDPEKMLFVNTRVPYSRLTYHRAGPKQTREERLDARLTFNFGKKLNVGLDADMINARGFYASQSVKHNSFSLYGNYLSDRFESHAFMTLGSVKNFENGGITDELFITDPDAVQQRFTSQDIPTKFTKTWNTVGNNRFFLSGRYNLGYTEIEGDTIESKEHFIPVASIGFSSQFTQQYRRFLSYDTAYVNVDGQQMHRIDQFYSQRNYAGAVDDSIHYTSFKNSVTLGLREGFKEWVKFGLAAFLEYDLRKYSLRDSLGTGYYTYNENAVTLGGQLNKQQGDNLLFNLRADLGVLGVNLGEFRAMGDVETGFDFFGKRTTLTMDGYVKNLRPKYLQDHYYSKYFKWDRDFGDIRRVYVGGKLHIPFTNTTLSAGVENVQNLIYFDKDKNIQQEGENIQVLTARVEQKIHLGIFNWDNEVVYQTSSNEDAIPLPELSAYSNMYLKTKIVNELTFQFGVDAHYHTKYFAPGYEPALLQFYNQQDREIGNYPISTVYANFHLKQTRFFVMFYNVATKVIKPQDYFTMPGYPVNPFGLKLGLSVNLHN